MNLIFPFVFGYIFIDANNVKGKNINERSNICARENIVKGIATTSAIPGEPKKCLNTSKTMNSGMNNMAEM